MGWAKLLRQGDRLSIVLIRGQGGHVSSISCAILGWSSQFLVIVREPVAMSGDGVGCGGRAAWAIRERAE